LLALILDESWMALAGSLIGANAVSRAGALYLLFSLAPARPDGASVAFGRPSADTFRQCLAIAGIIGIVVLPPAAGLIGAIAALAAAAGAALYMARLARLKFGGQTGDLVGAAQQLCDVAILLCIAIFMGS
jgi:adenosylcobinamide-GDP ribazoletransferase